MSVPVTLGLFGVNMGVCARPGAAPRVAALAERLGYDSLWVADHLVVPRPWAPPSPMAPDYPILDPVVALTALAQHTSRIQLATGIVVLPQRNPVVLAKQLASVDVLSEGRLTFGMGVGYLEPELRAVGVPLEERGARSVEYLQAMRSLWSDEEPAFSGRFASFEGVDAHPRPAQRPVPVVMGGHSRAAHRRAVRYADGWYGFMLDRGATAEQVASLRREAEAAGRDPDELSLTVSPSERLDPAIVAEYAAFGIDRLALLPPPAFFRRGIELSELEAFVEASAPDQLGARRRADAPTPET